MSVLLSLSPLDDPSLKKICTGLSLVISVSSLKLSAAPGIISGSGLLMTTLAEEWAPVELSLVSLLLVVLLVRLCTLFVDFPSSSHFVGVVGRVDPFLS